MKMLIGVDGSAGSDFAVSLMGRLLAVEAVETILYYSPPITVRSGTGHDEQVEEKARQALADRVFAHTVNLLPQPLARRAECVVGTEKARDGILAAAQQYAADLIVVGARGTNRFAKLLLGSVSRAVVHGSDVPVLVGRGTAELPDRPPGVVIACDRTGISAEAVTLVKQLAWPPDSVGYVVHVIESIFSGQVPEWLKEEALHDDSEPLSKLWVEMEAKNRQQVREDLAALCESLPPLFHQHAPVVLEGHAGEKVLEFISANGIDLAIVGRRHLGPVVRFFWGSTSEQVLAHANCSVLVVPHGEPP